MDLQPPRSSDTHSSKVPRRRSRGTGKRAITTELIRRLRQRPPSRVTDIWDTKLPRFVVRARPSGRHSFLVLLGRGRWYTLGLVETLKPEKARSLAQQKLGEVASGIDPRKMKRIEQTCTLLEFIDRRYRQWLVEHRRSGDKIIAQLIAAFGPSVGKLKLHELSAWHIEKWRTGRLKAGTSPATTNRDLGALRAMFNRAIAWGHVSSTPLATVKALPEDRIGRLRYLSPNEEKRLRAALTARDDRRRRERESANAWRRERDYEEWPALGTYTDHLTPMVLLALNTGLRFGELTGLRWRDVQLIEPGPSLKVVTEYAKSGRARHVPLNAEAGDVLRTWRPPNADSAAFVFPGVEGARLVDVKAAWMPLLKPKAANITGFRFHDLRHTFASNLVMRGTDLNTVRELLGHSDIKMTLRYAHLAPEIKAAAVAKLVSA